MPGLRGVFFDAGNTLVVEEPGKHLWEMAIVPLPGALEVLAALKSHYRLGVISNTVGSGDVELAAALDRAGLRSLIDALVTSRDFGRAKPDPAIYVEGARRLGIPLETTCMVGDRLDTGAAMTGGPAPTHIITQLVDLPAWLETMQQPPYSSS